MFATKQSGFFQGNWCFLFLKHCRVWAFGLLLSIFLKTVLLPVPEPLLATGIKKLCSSQEERIIQLIIITIKGDRRFKAGNFTIPRARELPQNQNNSLKTFWVWEKVMTRNSFDEKKSCELILKLKKNCS